MADLFTLKSDGFLFTEVAGDWNILAADFGDGFMAAANVGSPEGTRTWQIKIDALPGEFMIGAPGIGDALDPAFLLLAGGGFILLASGGRILLESASTRAAYLWRFFRVSKRNGDQPFWIEVEDPDDGTRKMYLASFVDHRLTYQVLCAKVYATGLQLRQRRLAGVESPRAAEV